MLHLEPTDDEPSVNTENELPSDSDDNTDAGSEIRCTEPEKPADECTTDAPVLDL